MGKKNDCSGPVIHATGFTINGCTFNVDTKYHPIGAIGQGSYGVVCSVRNTETDEKLAIKKITPMAGDEWDATHTLREIRLMRCLGAHENIISLKHLSMCKEKDELYMMMELADTDLHRLIQSSCALTPGHIRVIMYQILSGVKAMHDNGVLHRDLKPGNLLLNKDCELKITDFGLARMMPKTSSHPSHPEATASSDNVSMMTEYVVTRWYRPPELMLAPNGSYDGAVDMWSVGCILGELLARKPLFPGTDFMDQLTRIFQVIAIPKPDDRGYSIEKDALKFLSSLSPPVSGALEAKLGDLIDPQALDLLRRLLCFNPKTRLSSDDALAHPFFQGIEDEWGAISRLHLPHSLEFAFETQSLPLATLRQYICDEVLAFTTPKATEPHASESPIGKIPETTVSTASTTSKKDTIAKVLENDCPAGSGFTVKGCDFHVSERYKPLQVLGEGSYGIVCAASDSETRKNVAIKKITPMAGDEWDAKHTLREIRLMRYFGHHPNIASLQSLSTCMEKDELYLMMELMDTDLHRLIQSKTKLEPTHVAAIMYQLLCGAQTLHENGVLHRDLKPGNLLVSKNCDVKITDFGLSRYIPPTERHSTFKAPIEGRQESHSLMTEYVVTRWYRPPELMLAPTGTYNEAVDMWSIGCIFGELLNRRPLFPGSDFLDQLARVFRVLPLPSPAERGYDVEGDARAFLEKLPPCSPSALNALFPRASSEAVHLLQQLLCVNPKRRLSAKQALVHPYFNQIRSQLGDPPVFHVDKAFDFEFDYQDFPLTHLKTLIQSEVTLLQQQGLAPPSSALKPAVQDQEREAFDDDVYATEKLKATIDTPEDDLDASVLPASEPEADERKVVIKEQRKQQQDEEERNEKLSKPLETVEIEKPNNEEDILHSIVQDVKSSTGLKQPMASTAVSWKSSSAILQTTTPSTSLSRSKSTGTSLRRALTPSSLDSTKINQTSNISRESRDEDDVTSVASTSSNNRSHQKSTHSSSLSRKWGHSRSTAMASTASSRYRSAAQTSSTSLIHKTASLLSSRTSERLSSSDNNNQQYTRRLDSSDCESVKSDVRQSSMAGRNGAKSHRQLQVVSDPSSTSSSPSTAFTPETFTSRKGPNLLTRRPGSTSSSTSSSSSSTSLPKEWARRTDPKTGRLFYVHLVTNRSYAKLPSSVTTVMLNLGRDAIVKKRTEKMDQDRRRQQPKPKPKPTIPYSPQFTQMSWQRKKALDRHDCV